MTSGEVNAGANAESPSPESSSTESTPSKSPPTESPSAESPSAESPPSEGASEESPSAATTERTELDRLRAEVATLQGRLDTRERRQSRWISVRRVIAAILVALAGFGVVCSTIGVWGARTTLRTDRWVETVGPLPRDPAVAAAVSQYLTDEIFTSLNVEQRLAQALPPKAAFLSGAVTGPVHDYVRTTIQKFMQTEQFQQQWEAANRFAHSRILAILENKSQTVSVEGSTVTLNLLPIVNNLLVMLEGRLPTLFGKKLDLPALSSGEIPPNLKQRIESTLGVTLPANFAQIKLYNRHKLSQVQEAVLLFKRGVVLLVAGTILALGLAIWISPGRRRTILQFGVWLAIATLVLSNVLRALRDHLLALVPDGVYRQGASAAIHHALTDLRVWGDWLLWIGIVLAVLAYLVGPGRLPVWLRKQVVNGAKWTATTTERVATSSELRQWVAAHTDVLRIAGVVVAAVLALLVSSWTGLLVIVVLLALYELAVWLPARQSSA
ncbi:hypothetical protein J4573_10000 [Actinomadura barringtoniae]|uniref:Uncharacterized protein n=1 Tax=Actinomadura barringtoniae TaxID=1427535 RepID=A0A939P846_9ACTN|nr:hypothetical protein [Actinomadura barringtoniae]MBO2447418.1 hypothetical protein [Actinomadura barringtoniae]